IGVEWCYHYSDRNPTVALGEKPVSPPNDGDWVCTDWVGVWTLCVGGRTGSTLRGHCRVHSRGDDGVAGCACLHDWTGTCGDAGSLHGCMGLVLVGDHDAGDLAGVAIARPDGRWILVADGGT